MGSYPVPRAEWTGPLLLLLSMATACAQTPRELPPVEDLPPAAIENLFPPVKVEPIPQFLPDGDSLKAQPPSPPPDAACPEPCNPEPSCTSERAPRRVLTTWFKNLFARLFCFHRREKGAVQECALPRPCEAAASPKPHVWPPAHYTPGLDSPTESILPMPGELRLGLQPPSGASEAVAPANNPVVVAVPPAQPDRPVRSRPASGSAGSSTRRTELLGWYGSVPPSFMVTTADLREARPLPPNESFEPAVLSPSLTGEQMPLTLVSAPPSLVPDNHFQAAIQTVIDPREIHRPFSTLCPATPLSGANSSRRAGLEHRRPFWTGPRLCAVPLAASGFVALLFARRRPESAVKND